MNNNRNSGALFPNKKTKDTQPDFKGKLTINGVEWSIAAWNKRSKAGLDYLSLVAEVPTAPRDSAQNPSVPASGSNQPQAPVSSPRSQDSSQPSPSASPPSSSANTGASASANKVDAEFGDLFDGLD